MWDMSCGISRSTAAAPKRQTKYCIPGYSLIQIEIQAVHSGVYYKYVFFTGSPTLLTSTPNLLKVC